MSKPDIAFVSPPQTSGDPGVYKCYVESGRQLCVTFWTGLPQYPDLSSSDLLPLELSDQVSATWSCSELLGFGSYSTVRTLVDSSFPVVKIAHPNTEARQLIQHEYNTMRSLSHFTGAARVGPVPLKDKDGIYGFLLERLSGIDFEDLQMRAIEVRNLVDGLHEKGYCHGDLSPSNVMMRADGQLVLIDFAFSGVIGEKIAAHIPSWVYGSAVYETMADVQKLVRYFGQPQEHTE